MIGEELVGDDTEAGDDTEVGDQAGDDKGDHATDSSQRVRESLDISLGVSDALPSLDEAVEDSDRGLSRLPGRVGWYAVMQPGWQDANMSRAVRVRGWEGGEAVCSLVARRNMWWCGGERAVGRSPCASHSAKLKSGGRGG